MNTLKYITLSIAALALFLSGCAGARTVIKSDNAKYDVSFSSNLRASDGMMLSSENMDSVGVYNYKATGWGMVWSFVPLNSINLSKSINQQVETAGGNAITDFSIIAKQGMLNSFAIFSWLPFWPGYNTVYFSGKIQNVKSLAPSSQGSAGDGKSADSN